MITVMVLLLLLDLPYHLGLETQDQDYNLGLETQDQDYHLGLETQDHRRPRPFKTPDE